MITSQISSIKRPSDRPILESQSINSGKFVNIPRNQGKVMHQRDCRNLQIHGPDDTASSLQIVANDSIPLRTWIIKWQRGRTGQSFCDIQFPGSCIIVFFRAMHEFRSNGSACRQLRNGSIGKFTNQSKVLTLENLDPDIGVEQVEHHQVFAGGNGRSGGRSNSLSAQHPIISTKSGRLSLISSNVGGSFFSSTSEIALRTRDSKIRAFSGASRSKLRSSSSVIVVTGNFCHDRTRNSTSHFPTP